MHKVTSTIRRITAAEIPSTDPQALLNMGIVPLGNGYYSCREQENDIPTGKMEPVVVIPGTVLSEGSVQSRHDKLPAQVKMDLWRAKVRKTTGTGKNKRIEIVEVDASEVQPTDDVISAGTVRHRWAGERER